MSCARDFCFFLNEINHGEMNRTQLNFNARVNDSPDAIAYMCIRAFWLDYMLVFVHLQIEIYASLSFYTCCPIMLAFLQKKIHQD